jgi:hypothetical protein
VKREQMKEREREIERWGWERKRERERDEDERERERDLFAWMRGVGVFVECEWGEGNTSAYYIWILTQAANIWTKRCLDNKN